MSGCIKISGTGARKIKISGILLIAPWMELDKETIKEEGEEVKEIARPWMETPIDLKNKNKNKKYNSDFSDDDYFVPFSQKDLFEKELNAKIIVEHNMGHFLQLIM